MRVVLHTIQLFCALAIIAFLIFGITQFADLTEGESVFERFGRAAFAFLLLCGFMKLSHSLQKKIDQMDVVEKPWVLRQRLTDEAAERLQDEDLDHMEPKIA